MGKILFLSAVAFLAYKYISRSNKKVREIAAPKTGTVEILPPEKPTQLPTPRAIASPAAEPPLPR